MGGRLLLKLQTYLCFLGDKEVELNVLTDSKNNTDSDD